MEDGEIIELYFRRDEAALAETAAKYGALCRKIALNLLSDEADVEECVNDTYLRAWNSIPPQRPDRLGAWLGRVVRNAACDLWRKKHRQKRGAGLTQFLMSWRTAYPPPSPWSEKSRSRS